MRATALSRAVYSTLLPLSLAVTTSHLNAAETRKTGDQLIEAEIVVTARKREENLHQVPLSITAFNEAQLQSPLLGDISSLGAFAPNVDFNWTAPLAGSSNAASVFIRGVGQNDFLLTTDPGVGIYLDGVYISRSVGGVLTLADIERVEVLRGPQGTLFGKNSIGGAIQVVSRKPGEERQATVSATVGDWQRRDLSFSVEGGISENVQARLSLANERREGYVEKLLDGGTLGDVDRRMVKATVAYQPSDTTEWLFSVDHTFQRQEAIAQSLLEVVDSPAGFLFNAHVADPFAPYDERWVTGDPDTSYQTGPSQDDLEITGVSLTAEHHLAVATLTSMTGYRTMHAVYSRDPDGSPYAFAHGTNWDEHAQFTQELRLQGENGSVDWLVGLYYLREHGKNRTDVDIYNGLYDALVSAGDPFAPFFDTHFDVNNDQTTESAALFSQLTWAITDQLNLTAGARFTREEKAFSVNNYSVLTGTQVQGPTTVEDSWRNVSPMISVDYQWHENLMSYASLSRGFKSGGYNGRQIFPLPMDDFDPEFATTLELGVKTRLWQERVDLRASVFDTEYKDMQFNALLDLGGFLLPVTNNAAQAEIRGAELEVSLRNVQGLIFNAGVGYLDAGYASLDAEALAATRSKGADLIRVPRWNLSLDMGYRWALGEGGSLRLMGNASYKSKVYNDPANVESIAQDGYTLVNASLDWQNTGNDWSVEAFVTNVTDKRYLVTGATALDSTGFSEGHYSRPREWGLRVTYQY